MYTCETIDTNSKGKQTKTVCDSKHRSLAAADKCLHSRGMSPGMFKDWEGRIIEIETGKVVKRYRNTTVSSDNGKTLSMRARWVEIEITP